MNHFRLRPTHHRLLISLAILATLVVSLLFTGQTSAGTTPILFDTAGNSIDVVRGQPGIVAPDDTNTTFFGSDIGGDPDSSPNFPGTSVIAPHTSGVAALMVVTGVFDTMFGLGILGASKVQALGGPGGDNTPFAFRLDDPRPGEISGYSFTVIPLKTFAAGNKLTISFPPETDLTDAAVLNPFNYTIGDENAITPTAVTLAGQALSLTAGAGMDGDPGDPTPDIIESAENINVIIQSSANIRNNPVVDLTNILTVTTDVSGETPANSVNLDLEIRSRRRASSPRARNRCLNSLRAFK